MRHDLIYDIGMHLGRDTRFYLDKGFKVIAVEAAPVLVQAARSKFAADLASGQLVIIDKAIAKESGKTIDFYINPDKDDWGSSFKSMAEKGIGNAVQLQVETVTMHEVFAQYGIPYYLKCDIEGSDEIVVEQCLQNNEKPKFLSVELSHPGNFTNINRLGYNRAQLVNQQINPWVRPPSPAREGKFVDVRFDGHCTGLFGLELEPRRWITLEQASDRYVRWLNLRNEDDTLAIGWIDIHLTTMDA